MRQIVSWFRRVSLLGLTAVIAVACGVGERPVGAGEGAVFDYELWAGLLAEHQHAGGLDYAGMAADRGDLDRFVASLGAAKPGSWSEADQIAFWSNAYNAVVAHFVLERYPGIGSVEEVDGFFDTLTFPVAGAERTLDEIEGEARALGDARVHFAVVCASTSCPDLRGEPFVGSRLEEQLAEQTAQFLADPTKGLRYDAEDGKLWLSSIFKWYAGDFTGGSTVVAFFARGQVVDWILPRLPADLASRIEKEDPAVRYLDYDWSLNDRPQG